MNKLTILFAMIAVVLVSGCNTMQGMGKDIKKGGETIEKAAK